MNNIEVIAASSSCSNRLCCTRIIVHGRIVIIILYIIIIIIFFFDAPHCLFDGVFSPSVLNVSLVDADNRADAVVAVVVIAS